MAFFLLSYIAVHDIIYWSGGNPLSMTSASQTWSLPDSCDTGRSCPSWSFDLCFWFLANFTILGMLLKLIFSLSLLALTSILAFQRSMATFLAD